MRAALLALVAGLVLVVVAGSIAANVFIQGTPTSATTTSMTPATSSLSRAISSSLSAVSYGSSTSMSTSQTTYTQPTYPTTSTSTSSASSATSIYSTITETTTSSTQVTSSSSTASSTTLSSSSSTSSRSSSQSRIAMVVVPYGVGDNMSLNFQPASIKVVLGVNSTIVWNDLDYEQHNIESSTIPTGAKAWNSGTLNQGETYTVTLTVVGTYQYFCEIHPWMVGTIQVVA